MILETQSVSKLFGGLKAVDTVDLQVEKGEIRAIIGPNGSGKTTLLNIITGFGKASSGQVIFNGDYITNDPPHKTAKRGVARTFQNINLFGRMTVLDNVMVGGFCRTHCDLFSAAATTPRARKEARELKEKAKEIIRFVGLEGLEEVEARNLPYGQQRVLEIARALASNPRVLLLDEPVAGMNEKESEAVAQIILQLRESGVTIVLVEHHMRFVMSLCEKITVLNSGAVIAEGRPNYIQNHPEVIRVYLGKRSQNAKN